MCEKSLFFEHCVLKVTGDKEEKKNNNSQQKDVKQVDVDRSQQPVLNCSTEKASWCLSVSSTLPSLKRKRAQLLPFDSARLVRGEEPMCFSSKTPLTTARMF